MTESRYMHIIDPDVKTGQLPAKKTAAPLLSSKWLLIGAVAFLAFKGTKLMLIGGAGFAAGYYVRGKINEMNLKPNPMQKIN